MNQKFTTTNGLRILTNQMPYTRAVSIAFYIGAGSRYESDKEAGISHFVEHMCFKGTHKRPNAKDISEAIEGIGGVMNAATDRELTTYWCKVPDVHFEAALDVMVDIMKNPIFESREIEKERQVILEELAMTKDVPSYSADLLIDEVMWPDNPVGRDVGGSKESVSNISREMLLEYLRSQYTLPNMVISIAGNIDSEKTVNYLVDYFKDWQSHTANSWIPMIDEQSEPRIKIEYRKTEQAHICIGVKGIASSHKDRYSIALLNTILGEGMSSRLFVEVRENQGLAYDVHSSVTHLRDCGSFIVYAGVEPKNTKLAIKCILSELSKVKNGIAKEELKKAKEFLKGRLMLRMEDSRSVSSWYGSQELLSEISLTPEQMIEKVDAIETEDIVKVANDILITSKLNLALVGPFKSDKGFKNLLNI
jgi:predicted Zn-dependent peptidase